MACAIGSLSVNSSGDRLFLMRPERDTRISGIFEGWSPNAIYRLGDGSRWKLSRARSSHSNRSRPPARVWRYDSKYYLEIVESGEFAEVLQVL